MSERAGENKWCALKHTYYLYVYLLSNWNWADFTRICYLLDLFFLVCSNCLSVYFFINISLHGTWDCWLANWARFLSFLFFTTEWEKIAFTHKNSLTRTHSTHTHVWKYIHINSHHTIITPIFHLIRKLNRHSHHHLLDCRFTMCMQARLVFFGSNSNSLRNHSPFWNQWF